jgi:hypothetical protein
MDPIVKTHFDSSFSIVFRTPRGLRPRWSMSALRAPTINHESCLFHREMQNRASFALSIANSVNKTAQIHTSIVPHDCLCAHLPIGISSVLPIPSILSQTQP